MRRAAVVAVVSVALAGCGDGGASKGAAEKPPRGKAVKETRSRARQRIDDSRLSPKLKRELREAQDLLDKAPKD